MAPPPSPVHLQSTIQSVFGEDIKKTGEFIMSTCSNLNLEFLLLHLKFQDIRMELLSCAANSKILYNIIL